jgi:hypothetical protein
MKYLQILLLTWILSSYANGQGKNYFQQRTDYYIQVKLDDKNHNLSGALTITYTNNSPETLHTIYLHLWGNAFKDPESAFGKQQLQNGKTNYFFADASERGYYSGLDFTVNGQKVELIFEKDNFDIGILNLPEPLFYGQSVDINTPFILKIPASFSRLGHVGESYQMTQWYPKPAVFDHKGWHPMPYLDMGEFYSEFGNFTVSITLPENYVVGATGELVTESEITFLEQKASETEQMFRQSSFNNELSFPESSDNLKTIVYKAENVHDFAWFADKRFHVQKSKIVMPSGRNVTTWTMFTNEQLDLWKQSIDYVNRAIVFYSERVGEYPYPQATVVQSALSAGGGMEYPMITVIGKASAAKDLDQVITHEVGHNWFYGILATNERDHPWMDEGINSFYEYAYTHKYYGNRVVELLPDFLKKGSKIDLYETAYLLQARRRLDQAPETTSNNFGMINYGISSYIKTGSSLRHLEAFLGKDLFETAIKQYYEKWQFRHPYPEDLRQLLEKVSGKNLDWFFEGYINTNALLDYSIKQIIDTPQSYNISIMNQGEIAAPFPVSGLKNGEIVLTRWFEAIPVGEQRAIEFPKGDFELLVIDAEHVTLEVFRLNNNIKTAGGIKTMEPVRLKFLGALEHEKSHNLYWLPIPVYNKYDGFQAGVAFYNSIAPAKNLEFSIAPMFGTASKAFNGMGNIRYNIFPKNEKIRKLVAGLDGKAFHYRHIDSLRTETGNTSTTLQYRRLAPFLRLELMRSHTSGFYQNIELRSILLQKQHAEFETRLNGAFYQGNSWNSRVINSLSWEIGNRRVLQPYRICVGFEQQRYEDFFGKAQSYLKASLEYNVAYMFAEGRAIQTRIFAGKFFQSDARRKRGFIFEEAFNLTSQGFNDYRFENLYIGRTENQGLFSRQIMPSDGGLKVALGGAYSEGRSNDMIVALNLKSDLPKDLPFNLPVQAYFDIAWYNDTRPISSDLSFSDQVWWQGGFSLSDKRGIFALNFPVISSGNVSDLYKQSGRSSFFKRISFTLNFQKLNPWNLIDDLVR